MAATRGAGAEYVMVIHPDRLHLEDDLFDTIRSGAAPASFDRQKPQTFLLSYCRQRRLACLDLLPAFRSRHHDGSLYLTFDTHYNEQGNAIAASAIADFLKERRLTGGCGV